MKSKVARMLSQIGDANRPVDQHPLVREKIATRDQAALDLKRTIIRAPVGGTTVNVKLQPGEYVEPDKPLLALVVDNRPWVEANFKETELTHVREGMTAHSCIGHLSRRRMGSQSWLNQPSDRRRICASATAERIRQLGESCAAPACPPLPQTTCRRTAVTRWHDSGRQRRHQA